MRILVFGSLGLLATHCAQDTPERIATVYALKADPTPANVAEIRTMLDDPDRDVRATALNALVTLGVADGGAIAKECLEDEDGFVRATAAKLLGDLADPADVPLLVERLLGDVDPIVRQRSAEALAKIEGAEALDGLTQGLDDPMENVRLASVKGIRRSDPSHARAALARLVLEDSMWEIRVQAANALGLSCDPTVGPALKAALQDPNEFVRGAAANAIRVLEQCPDSGTDAGAGS